MSETRFSSPRQLVPLEGIGSNAEISIGRAPDGLSLADDVVWPGSMLLKRLGSGRSLDAAECDVLRREFVWYYQKLRIHGFPISFVFGAKSFLVGDQAELWVTERYVRGDSLDLLWRSPRLSVEAKFAASVELLSASFMLPESVHAIQVGALPPLPLLAVGVDLKPANIVVPQTGRPVLVDLYPPLILEKGEVRGYSSKVYAFGPTKLKYVCATKVGIATRLWWLLRNSSRTADRELLDRLFVEYFQLSNLSHGDRSLILSEAAAGFPVLAGLYR